MANPESIFSILKDGGEKAKSRAEQTMKIVRSQVGLE